MPLCKYDIIVYICLVDSEVTDLKNGKRILIGDNSYDIGRILSTTLAENGFETMCRRNDIPHLKNEIISSEPDVAVICVTDEDDPACALISELAASDCRTKLLAAVFTLSHELCRDIIDSGADRCILMPASMNKILDIVTELSCAHRTVPFEPEVISFLSENGLPNHIKGFNFLSTSVGLCITNPEYLSDITNTLYKKIAEIYDTTPVLVERAIRHVAMLAHENGSDVRLAETNRLFSVQPDAPLTNYELICIATDAFADKYGLYR